MTDITNLRYVHWREWVDGILHLLHAPRFIQRRVCDWLDRKTGMDGQEAV